MIQPTRTGQFTQVNGNLGPGKQFTVSYAPTTATVVATPPPAPRITLTVPRDGGAAGPGSIRPGDTLQLSVLARNAEGARFRFPTETGRKYRLEGTADLASGEWTVLLDNIEAGGEVLELLDAEAATLSRYFYRIILLP